MSRKVNFYPGPAALPLPVLERAQKELVDYQGLGLSLMETSHRSAEYEAVHNRAIELIVELLGVPKGYRVLFLGGGATLQFAMVPMNLLPPGGTCDFTLTGSWASKAYEDAAKIGKVEVVFDGQSSRYTTLPESLQLHPGAAYLHLTTNETIGGVQWQKFPETGGVPIVSDMSSDFLSRAVPVDRFGLIYAGAQKNLGPAGATVVIIREDLLDRVPKSLPAYLSYKTHSDGNSLYNTPPAYCVYMIELVLEWLQGEGGLEKITARNEAKAKLLYDAIDGSGGFYRNPVDKRYRSRMNVVFRLPSEDLEKRFVKESEQAGMLGLKGHRSVGGMRASIYNATSIDGVRVLADFMGEFARKNG
jgi:phosphoserine aminotransferase